MLFLVVGGNLSSCRHDQHKLLTYANGANPFAPADFDIGLPLRFTRAEFIWRDHLPFLPWADELVARGASLRPSYATISFFEIENHMLGFVDMTALRTERLIDAALSVGAVFRIRILNFMRLNNFVDCSTTSWTCDAHQGVTSSLWPTPQNCSSCLPTLPSSLFVL